MISAQPREESLTKEDEVTPRRRSSLHERCGDQTTVLWSCCPNYEAIMDGMTPNRTWPFRGRSETRPSQVLSRDSPECIAWVLWKEPTGRSPEDRCNE